MLPSDHEVTLRPRLNPKNKYPAQEQARWGKKQAAEKGKCGKKCTVDKVFADKADTKLQDPDGGEMTLVSIVLLPYKGYCNGIVIE